MNDLIVKEEIKIENMIYDVRGKQVMLDSDLAALYGTSTGNLNRAKKRNTDRFPNDFSFQLSKEEYINLKCQNGISNIDNRAVNRGLPFVYTEEGVAMLSSVLHTKVASKVSVKIMQAFVAMKKYISTTLIEQKNINNQVLKNTEDIKLLQESFNNFSKNKINTSGIFFEGQIYDSYSLLLDIFNTSKDIIIIIDNYIDKVILDVLRKINEKVMIITNKYNNNDYTKYKEQYKNIELIINNKIHDRFIIVDKKTLYHCGASLKDLGKKCFAINKIENKEWLEKILRNIYK